MRTVDGNKHCVFCVFLDKLMLVRDKKYGSENPTAPGGWDGKNEYLTVALLHILLHFYAHFSNKDKLWPVGYKHFT